jgi:hypothetical protein
VVTIDGPQRWAVNTTSKEAHFLYPDPGVPEAAYCVICKLCKTQAKVATIDAIVDALPSLGWDPTWSALACRCCGSTTWSVGLAATETADYRRFVRCAVCRQAGTDEQADAVLDRVSWDVWVDAPSSAADDRTYC